MLLILWAGQLFIVRGGIAGKCTENVTYLALAYQMPKVPTSKYGPIHFQLLYGEARVRGVGVVH